MKNIKNIFLIIIGKVLISILSISAQLVGVNNRVDDLSSFGFIGLKGDFESVAFNPAIIVSTIPKKDFSLSVAGNYITKPSYAGYFGINSAILPFPVLLGYQKNSFDSKIDDSVFNSDIFSFNMGLTDPVAGTGLIGGVRVKYIHFSKTENNNIATGNVLTSDIGLIKQWSVFKLGTTWHTGGKIKWNVQSVLENAVSSAFSFMGSWNIHSFFLVMSWNHIFPARSYASYESTKQIILRDAEDRVSFSTVMKINRNLNIRLGANNLQYNLSDYQKRNQIMLKAGALIQFQDIVCNILFLDNSLIALSKDITPYRYVGVSINYNFSL